MSINFGKKFSKQYDRADHKIKKAFQERINIFLEDQHDPILNNHLLTGEYLGCRSINVTGNWRAIYSKDKEEITFHALGTHSELYK